MKRFSLPTALLLGSSAVCAAPASVFNPVIVTATRTAQTADESLASVTVITRDDIERSQAQTLPDALRGVPGLTLSNNGGDGKLTSVFLRGTNFNHVLVLVDGIKIGNATAGNVAFQDLPLDQVERIEVVRGPRSSLYGSEAIGGVIQIFTRKGKGAPKPRASVTVGSHDSLRGDVGVSGGNDKGWFNAGFSAHNTDGFNSCRPEAAAAFAGCFANEPDRDGYRNRSATLRAGHKVGDNSELEFNWLRSEGNTEFDGWENRAETVNQVLSARLKTAMTATWDSTLQLGRSWDLSDNFSDSVFSSRFDTRRDSAGWQNDIALGDNLLTLGADYQNDQVSSTTDYTRMERDNKALFGEYQFALEGVDLSASLRGDDNEQFGYHTTGSLAAGYDLTPDLRLTASYGTAFKAPTFNDLYWPADPFFGGGGNPDLKPEKSRSLEVGLSGPVGKGDWSLNLYQTRIRDLIVLDSMYVPMNLDKARIRGLEAVLKQSLGPWDLNGSLTLLDPEDRTTGNDLPRRARRALQVDLDRYFGAWSVGGAWHAEGRRYDDAANTRRLGGYATLDLHARYAIARDWKLGAKVSNLFDKDYETAAFYNQDGRAYYITLAYQP